MAKAAVGNSGRIDRFFAGSGAWGDQRRNLVELAEASSSGSGSRAAFDAALNEITAKRKSPATKRAA